MPKRLVGVTLAVLFLCRSALAWSGAGHMVIAAEAYRQLSPKLKRKVTQVLKAHPEYARWEAEFIPGKSDLDLAGFVFMQASTWPDEIRRNHSQFDHPHWHYMDYPLRPTSFPPEPSPTPGDDALFGIEQSEKVLEDGKAPPELRAVYLSWLLHLIGDLHQPLHCGSLVNETYPRGDKGGNDFYVMPGSRGIALHAFWDELLGTSSKASSHFNYAIRIRSEHPRKSLSELKTARTPEEWSLESRQVAIEEAYLRGKLKGSVTPETAPSLPEGYRQNAKIVAERQAALAGYRLADEIKAHLR